MKNSYSGWSKLATRCHQCDYDDRSRQWEDHKAHCPAEENEEVFEAVAVAEVEAVENRDQNHGRPAADSATCTAPRTLLGTLRRQRLRRKKL